MCGMSDPAVVANEVGKALVEEFDFQIRKLWGDAQKKCESESDVELLLRMQDCDFTLLSEEKWFIKRMFSSRSEFEELYRRRNDTAMLLVDILGMKFIRHQRDRLLEGIDLLDKANLSDIDLRRKLHDRCTKMCTLIDINNKMENNGAGK